MSLFSFIIPIYNTGLYLRQCLDSVLAQSFTDFEAILVNDGSTDNSLEICEEYCAKDDRFRLINKANGGLVSARIAGADESKGEYCICLDSDDWISPDYLESIHLCIVEHHSPDIIFMGYFHASDTRIEKYQISMRSGYYTKAQIENEIFPMLMRKDDDTCMPGQLWAKAFKANAYKLQQQQVGLLIKIGEDKACSIACVRRANSIAVLDYCGYFYRMNPSSMTKNRKPFSWNGPELVGKHLESQFNMADYDFKEQLYRFISHEVAIIAASRFFQKMKYKEVCNEINNALQNPYYAEAINNVVYRHNMMAKVMVFALKNRFYSLLYLYNRIFQ